MITAKIVLVLVYMWISPDQSVDVRMDKMPMASMEVCEDSGPNIVELLEADPRFVKGIAAACVPVTVTEV